MRFDIILLSYGVNAKFRQYTIDCIRSLKKAENQVKFDILVLENGIETEYKGAKTVFYKKEKFNYNASLNYGISITRNPYIVCCNNDLVFYRGFAENLYYAFKMGYKSVSPYCGITHPGRGIKNGNHIIEGHQVGFQLAGWCIGVEREMIKDLGGFHEGVEFWYSDNIYSEQLQIADVKHALVCSARVDHIGMGSQTLARLPKRQLYDVTRKQYSKYQKTLQEFYGKT